MTKILGLSAFYHDSAAALTIDGRVVAAAQEERFSRQKHDAGFPLQAAAYCLQEAGLHPDELDAVAFYDKPFLKFERLLETYYAFAPRGLASFVHAIPIWLKEKLFLKRLLRQSLRELGASDPRKLKLLFPEHHLSHAASTFYPSSFEEAAILTVDGVGEWATTTIARGRGSGIEVLREVHFPHSLGLFYSACTYFLGFRVNSGEYKLMGLAPYGNPQSQAFGRYYELLRSQIIHLYDDGSLWLNPAYFSYATGMRMIPEKRWERLFGFPRRQPEGPIEPHHYHLALAIQRVTEDAMLNMAAEAKRLTGARYLCLAGGVALNGVANGKVQRSKLFEDLFITPAAGDAGGALGAALAAHHLYFGQPREASCLQPDGLQGAFLGPAPRPGAVKALEEHYGARAEHYARFSDLAARTASLLAAGKVVGWVQGRMEYGPRALGARSILADPGNAGMQRTLNLRIKFRESFRPFAPAVLAEEAAHYFDCPGPSPYMLLIHPVSKDLMPAPPDDYAEWDWRAKLSCPRSRLPAITHVDGSARIQTVHAATNPRFHELLQAFKALTGYGVLINTSFNIRGEPIVCTAEDAYLCFLRTGMDYLVIDHYFFDKTQQPKTAL